MFSSSFFEAFFEAIILRHKPFVKHHLEELDPELDNPPIPVINDDDLDY
jgi:hypothetical protein